jgi:putative transcriptional regulator
MTWDQQDRAQWVSDIPPFVDDPAFDPRHVLGLDPWPPRRPLNALQRARIARGVSQLELAGELGVSRQTVSSMENRRHVPSVRLALAVARALHTTVEEIFRPDERSS